MFFMETFQSKCEEGFSLFYLLVTSRLFYLWGFLYLLIVLSYLLLSCLDLLAYIAFFKLNCFLASVVQNSGLLAEVPNNTNISLLSFLIWPIILSYIVYLLPKLLFNISRNINRNVFRKNSCSLNKKTNKKKKKKIEIKRDKKSFKDKHCSIY